METVFSKKNLPMLIVNIATILVVAIMLLVNEVAARPSLSQTSQSLSNGVLSYQGTLTDQQGTALTGTYEMAFRIYPTMSGGTPLWTESRLGTNAVSVDNGLFSLMLGSLVPIPLSAWEQPQLYLGVQVGNDPEMTPREKLTFVPGAAKADVAQLAMTVPDGSITGMQITDGSISLDDLAEQPYYFYGALATPSEWMADVIFNGNYTRFCESIGQTYSRAETLTAHYTEAVGIKGRGNGFFYLDWYYVGTRVDPSDLHYYGNGSPEDPYNVWIYKGAQYAVTSAGWTFERNAIIWCKP